MQELHRLLQFRKYIYTPDHKDCNSSTTMCLSERKKEKNKWRPLHRWQKGCEFWGASSCATWPSIVSSNTSYSLSLSPPSLPWRKFARNLCSLALTQDTSQWGKANILLRYYDLIYDAPTLSRYRLYRERLKFRLNEDIWKEAKYASTDILVFWIIFYTSIYRRGIYSKT